MNANTVYEARGMIVASVLSLAVVYIGWRYFQKPKDEAEDKNKGRLSEKEYRPFELTAKQLLTDQVCLFTFRCADSQSLELPTGRHISVRCTHEGKPLARSYTPIKYGQDDTFQILMKKYEGGKMGAHLHSLNVGDCALMKGPTGRLTYTAGQFEVKGFGNKPATVKPCSRIGLVAGGTGITPCLQIVTDVLKGKGSEGIEVWLVFANSSPADVLLEAELRQLKSEHPSQFHLHFLVSKPDSSWEAKEFCGSGRIGLENLRQNLPPAKVEGSIVLYCGPPAFEKACKALLSELSFPDNYICRW